MKKLAEIKEFLAAAVFLLLGGCLLLSAAGILADANVRRESTELPDGRAALWMPRTGPVIAVSDAGEDGHDHGLAIESGGAALVLTGAFDGSRSLAAELARRGVTVLLYRGHDGAGAWKHLRELRGDHGAMALLAGTDRAQEALALAQELWADGKRPAAVMLLGEKAAVRAAADYPGGNILVLTRTEPDPDTLTAYYGSRAAAERGFDGFFGEGTARACAWDREFGSFARRETLARVAEWKGSTLGHAVELPDGDLIFSSIILCRVGAAACLLLAAGTTVCGLRRRGSREL